MRALKTVVILMALVILVGAGALVGVLVERSYRIGGAAPPTAARLDPTAPAAGAGGEPARLALGQPPGTRVLAMVEVNGLLVLHLVSNKGAAEERLVVIDPARGRIVGTIGVTEAP